MFNTTKSKIALIVFTMLIVLSIVLSIFSYVYLRNSKFLVIRGCSYTIAEFAQDINKDIIRIEDNARDLALVGRTYFNSISERTFIEHITKNVIENYPNALGGGLWYEPYVVNNNRFYSIYAYRNQDGKISIDRSFETPEYNYPEQNWYTEIINKISKERDVAWSTPYFEKEGSKTFLITAGSGIYSNNKLVGISTVDWEIASIVKSVYAMKPTPNSFSLFADEKNDRVIVSTDPNLINAQLTGKSLENIPWYNKNLRNTTYITYHNEKFIPYVKTLDNGMVFIVCVPKNELLHFIFVQVTIVFSVLILISSILSLFLYIALKRNITNPINILVDIANKISKGDLSLEIKLEKPEEFAHLAATFDKMIKDIKSTTKQKERIESELSIAKQIQKTSLPDKFPPYPDRYDFDIYASMDPAYDVGGDFYDFYFIDENKLMFLVADVSGKGVPAALFMMTVKTLINILSKTKLSSSELVKKVNDTICLNNKQDYFVTSFIGIFDFEKEKLTCINCGHNPPLIKQNDGQYHYLELKPNIVLGAMKDADFEVKELDFNSNNEIFIYTDGVTEAMDKDNKLYSEERLQKTLNINKDIALEQKCKNVKEDVLSHVNGVQQSDDITMLAFKYYGKTNSYKNTASKENYQKFYMWLSDNMDQLNVPNEIRQSIELSFEEIYTNVFSYAYTPEQGEVQAVLYKENDNIVLKFTDWGKKYNPLEKPDPDINLEAEERTAGGLGIFMVKQLSKDIEYKYEDANILTIKF